MMAPLKVWQKWLCSRLQPSINWMTLLKLGICTGFRFFTRFHQILLPDPDSDAGTAVGGRIQLLPKRLPDSSVSSLIRAG